MNDFTDAESKGADRDALSRPADTVAGAQSSEITPPATAGPQEPTDTRPLPNAKLKEQPASMPEMVAGYKILGLLGRGAMGVVYKAEQPGLKRLVALKMIIAGEHASEWDLARFRSEAEAAAHLQHPHIVQIYEVGVDNGRPYFSLEFVDGVSLAAKIDSTPQPPREAARLVQILAATMETAHQKGVVHRDLKPANVLLTADGIPKISDFGLAKRLQEGAGQTCTGMVLGTPSYMAPEQAEGRTHDIGPRSDVYALGAVLYEMLTGRAPFKSRSVFDTLEQVRTREPVAPLALLPSLPRDLETICLKCLQKDPAQRYPSAGALADDLRRFLDSLPIHARPVSLVERLWRWSRRNPRVALLSVIVILVILSWAATSSVLAFSLKRQKDATEEARIHADTNARLAVENAERAEKNAQTARTKHQLAIQRMIGLGEQMQKRLRTRSLSGGASADLRGVREDLLRVLRETMVVMAKDIGDAEVTAFGMVVAHQQMGDLLKKIGQGGEALEQYRQGYEAVKKIAAEKPDSDLARANLGVMLLRLGDMALELDGDVHTARKYYREGYDIQQAIAAQPHGKDYTEADNKRLLSHYAVRSGKVELATGDLPAARRDFEEALQLRRSWMSMAPTNVQAQSFLSEVYLWLGVLAGREDDLKEAKRNFDQCLKMCGTLAERFPNSWSFKTDLAEAYGHHGDAQVRFGLFDEAAKSYEKSRAHLLAVLNHDPEDMSRQRLVARTHERLAAMARRQQKQDEAAKRDQEALKTWDELVQIEPNDMTCRAALVLALARAGKVAEARKGATELTRRCPNSPELLLQVARSHAVSAASVSERAQRRPSTQLALASLQQAVTAGWRDARLIETEPDLTPLRKEPAYLALLAKFPKLASTDASPPRN
jgi:serine/threonine-protein kinase